MDQLTKHYEITFELRQDYLYARVDADVSGAEASIEQFREIIAKCEELDASRLLVVQTVPNVMTMPEMFDAAAGVVKLGLGGIKIAYVDTDPDHFENIRFAEMVGTNRGANAKVFVSIEEAEEWLLSGQA